MKAFKSMYCESPSSSSSEDEGVSSRPGGHPPPPQLTGIPCKNPRCDQELLCVNNADYFCSRDCYHSKLDRDKIGETGIQMRRITINGRGGTGLLRDRSLLDHLRIRVDPVLGRQITIHNSGFDASRWKRQATGKDGLSADKVADGQAKKKRNEEKQRLKELLGGGGGGGGSDSSSSEDSSTSDGDADDKISDNVDKQVVEEAHEEIRTILSSGVNSSICAIHPPVGKKGTRLKGYIINIASPWELYIKTEDMILKTDEIHKICNRPEGIDPRSILPLWLPEVGGYCAAKYEGELYRAKILERIKGDNGTGFRVKYVDWGNVSVVPQSEVFQLDPELTLVPRQYFFFKMSNVKPMGNGKTWGADVCQFLMEHLDGGIVELELESVERGIVHWGFLSVLSSLSGEVQGDLGKILVERKMAEPDSFYL